MTSQTGRPPRIRRVKPWRETPQKRLRAQGWRRWLLWWIFLPLVLVGLLLAPSADGGAAGAALLTVGGTALAGWEWIWRRTTLELSVAGLRLRQVGCTLETSWSNVADFHAEQSHEGFVLAEPIDTPGARRLASFGGLADMHHGAEAGWIAARRFVPIAAFGWHLRRGTLAADVSALAPHLAAAMSAARTPPSAPRATPAQRRRQAMVWLTVGAVVVVSIVLGWIQPPWTHRLLDVAYAAVAPLVVLQAGMQTWRFARGRQWGMTLLLALSTLVASGWCAVAWERAG